MKTSPISPTDGTTPITESQGSPLGSSVTPTSAHLLTLSDSRFKTKMCRSYMKTGACIYGAKCQFAHGATELRTPAENALFRLGSSLSSAPPSLPPQDHDDSMLSGSSHSVASTHLRLGSCSSLYGAPQRAEELSLSLISHPGDVSSQECIDQTRSPQSFRSVPSMNTSVNAAPASGWTESRSDTSLLSIYNPTAGSNQQWAFSSPSAERTPKARSLTLEPSSPQNQSQTSIEGAPPRSPGTSSMRSSLSSGAQMRRYTRNPYSKNDNDIVKWVE